jgi:hypothetical protein
LSIKHYKTIWNQHAQALEVELVRSTSNTIFSNCCGSKLFTKRARKYSPPLTGDTRHNGILLVEGKKWTEGQHDKNLVQHVKTKNGVITLNLRVEW